ncbi:ABC transporter permease [Spongiimicrobium salis]|uniref:ABC transporter permease n=1 Tax=Spongiimicrobium salis TaxID=1667022 RepID=UPI00374CA296
MIKNYIKIAWRNLWKNTTFTLLNVIGLSVAFGVSILLAMAAFFDLSYDQFHENGDNVYQVYTIQQTAKGPEVSTSNPAPFAHALQEEVPGIDKVTRQLQDDALVIYGEKELNFDGVWVDNAFFSMFSFPIEKGAETTPLKDNSSVVITQKTAEILFGEANPINKVVHLLVNGKEQPFSISAVVQDMPRQSSLSFDIAIPFESHGEYERLKDVWDAQNHDVYVQLQQGVAVAQFEKATASFSNLHFQGSIENAKRDGVTVGENGQYRQLKLLPLVDRHFTSFRNGAAHVSRSYSYLILFIAFLILFIASVNFINMGIARSAQRLKEIGMRKTLGAQKKQLFLQFWSESFLVFMTAVGIGILLSTLLLNQFKTLFRTGVTFEAIITPFSVLCFIGALLLITLFVGGYPAFMLSKLGTVQALKGKLENTGKNRVRDALMVIQFSIAIALISGTLVLQGQLDYMRNKELGFNKEQVIAFPLNGKKDTYEAVQLLREELKGNPDILSVSGSDNILGMGKDGSAYTSRFGFDYKGRGVKTNMLIVDHDYAKTLDLEIVQGRDFSREYATDSLSLVINETMALELGEENPLNAKIMMDSTLYSVIGVIKDYNFQRLNRKIEPITFFMNNDWELYYAYVKTAPGATAQSIKAVEEAWAAIEPNAPFLGSFLDENVDRTFRREKVMTTMISSGSILAIALSCIGLFAISLLVVTQRTKEIGVRKVVGASVASITFMLTKDFLKLVAIAFLIASPIAWWFMQQWLQDYPYRISLSIWFFIGAGLLTVVVALLTVGARTIKAALQNPVKSLRTE